jgi:hypothetical protein
MQRHKSGHIRKDRLSYLAHRAPVHVPGANARLTASVSQERSSEGKPITLSSPYSFIFGIIFAGVLVCPLAISDSVTSE